MSRRIPVFDHTASRVLFYEKRSRVTELVTAGVLFVLSVNPPEAAFVSAPASGGESATLGAGAIVRAADGSARPRRLLTSRRTIQMKFKKNPDDKGEVAKERSFAISQSAVPEELIREMMGDPVLYFPNAGR